MEVLGDLVAIGARQTDPGRTPGAGDEPPWLDFGYRWFAGTRQAGHRPDADCNIYFAEATPSMMIFMVKQILPRRVRSDLWAEAGDPLGIAWLERGKVAVVSRTSAVAASPKSGGSQKCASSTAQVIPHWLEDR